jgi:hypothetical protein
MDAEDSPLVLPSAPITSSEHTTLMTPPRRSSHPLQSPISVAHPPFSPPTSEQSSVTLIGTFSRKSLDDMFGNGFSSQGQTKRGQKTEEIFEGSRAVKSGDVLIKLDGTIDQRSKAVKSGSVVLREDGAISSSESHLIQSKELRTKSTHACHIVSFEVMDYIFNSSHLEVSEEVAADIVRALNKDDNLLIKSVAGNYSGTISAEGRGDRSLDSEIIAALASGGRLSEAASARARRQIQLILNSRGQFPIPLIRAAREKYTALVDDQGHKICRKNALIKKVDTDTSRLPRREGLRSATPPRTPPPPPPRPPTAPLKAPTAPPKSPIASLLPRKESGLKNNGEPDLRTTVGKQLAAHRPSVFSSPPPVGRARTAPSSHRGSFSGSFHSSSGSANGRAIFTGPRGGSFYVNSKGRKTYV